MKNGILREDEGYDLVHNGQRRSFRDTKEAAFEAARFAKGRNPDELIEIVDRANGVRMIMLEDGRTG